MRNNQFTIDAASRQKLSTNEIEELKKAGTGSGKEIIAKIMKAHSAIDEKTKFSLAKYILTKTKKFLKRFTVLPMDVNLLTEWLLEKEAQKIMELRTESLGLITSWGNVHHAGNFAFDKSTPRIGGGRWLVVDDTAGLIVAAIAEKMGLLYPKDVKTRTQELEELRKQAVESYDQMDLNDELTPGEQYAKAKQLYQMGQTNTITLVHSNLQPNISMLKYFGFTLEDSISPHPLFTNLLTLSWLQLLDPENDTSYTEEPEVLPKSELQTMKTARRSAYYRKRRRWERVKRVVDNTREGGFDGLIVSSWMAPEGVLKHLVPLVRGGGQIVVYSPTAEPLAELTDCYSKQRRAAYINNLKEIQEGEANTAMDDSDFPVDPTLILHAALQSSRATEWQVLPLRTHPMMTARGGAEGYIFTGTRVIPSDMPVMARGRFERKRKADNSIEGDMKRSKDQNIDTPSST
jgi:tRNA (adenine-N(1)-)-methyltransferase non-catalytic subunit